MDHFNNDWIDMMESVIPRLEKVAMTCDPSFRDTCFEYLLSEAIQRVAMADQEFNDRFGYIPDNDFDNFDI